MERLVTWTLVGLAAQLIDGALGMGYGATSATLLIGAGTAPLAASASIHLAELGTTLVSGASHWRFGNVDWPLVRAIAFPGAAGAFIGALVLTSVPGDEAAPWIAGFLFLLGLTVVARFAFGHQRQGRPHSRRFLGGLGAFAGFADAVGGGGWGPIATPTLLANGHHAPRHVVGSVGAAEFVVTLAAAAGFSVAMLRGDVDLTLVGALLAGGVVAAPLAAWLVRLMHARLLGTLVGGMILVTNARTIAGEVGIDAPVVVVVYAIVLIGWAVALTAAVRAIRREGVNADELSPPAVTEPAERP